MCYVPVSLESRGTKVRRSGLEFLLVPALALGEPALGFLLGIASKQLSGTSCWSSRSNTFGGIHCSSSQECDYSHDSVVPRTVEIRLHDQSADTHCAVKPSQLQCNQGVIKTELVRSR